MDEQMTGMSAMAAPRGSAQEESSRVRGRLTALLPLYAAITAAAVMIVFVAMPFHGFLTVVAAGTSIADRLIGLFFSMGLGIVLVPIALTHALGLRAILTNLQRNGAALAEGEMGALDKLMIGLAILHTAFLALVFMPRIRPSNLLRSVLLAAAAVAVIFTVLFFPLLGSATNADAYLLSTMLAGYIAIFAILALAFMSRTRPLNVLRSVLLAAAAVAGTAMLFLANSHPGVLLIGQIAMLAYCGLELAVPVLRVARSLRDKRLSRSVLIAAACGLAAVALIIPLALLMFYLLTHQSPYGDGSDHDLVLGGVALLFYGLSAILVLLLFLLGPLLRASAAYARLRNADGSAPEA